MVNLVRIAPHVLDDLLKHQQVHGLAVADPVVLLRRQIKNPAEIHMILM